MSQPPSAAFPWITIPRFAQPGQPHAFANRKEQLAQLYKAIVAAGNAVRAGQPSGCYRAVVSGYMGTGKSALILQALGMLRDEIGIANGQKLELPPGLPEPDARERILDPLCAYLRASMAERRIDPAALEPAK